MTEKFLKNTDRFTMKFLPANAAEILLIGNGIFYVLSFILRNISRINLYGFTGFFRDLILRGEVWRVITYIFSFMGDMSTAGLLFSVFTFMIFRSAISVVAGSVGYRRLNSILFIMYIVVTLQGFITGYADFTQVFFGMILVAGLLNPSFGINFYFFIPIRGGILSLIYAVIMIMQGVRGNFSAFAVLLVIVMIFSGLIKSSLRMGNIRGNSRGFAKPVKSAPQKVARHRCTVCRKTELTDPDMTFRYCSKCDGAFEYCEDHINNHEHRSNVVKFEKRKDQSTQESKKDQ